jgi:hypothetical protein
MRFLWRWLKRGVLALLLLVLLLLAPVAWTELACRGTPLPQDHQALLPPEDRRAEERTYTTYPEWHIVHAYDDYAKVIATGDPHDFGFIRAIGGFWSSLCPLAQMADEHGGFTTGSKMTIYTIGVSFTAEMLLKAAYEETLGRAAAWMRGDARAPLDDLSARQAADYAVFLQQTPWYKWDFPRDAAALAAADTGTFRDRERDIALGLEFGAKAAYAGVIAGAVASTGQDELTIRSVVTGLTDAQLTAIPDVRVVGAMPQGTVIETPRYRVFTRILEKIAAAGGQMVEIAGNDDILLTAISSDPTAKDALFSFPRQGYGDYRHLIGVRVADLSATLHGMSGGTMRLEHVHDY